MNEYIVIVSGPSCDLTCSDHKRKKGDSNRRLFAHTSHMCLSCVFNDYYAMEARAQRLMDGVVWFVI